MLNKPVHLRLVDLAELAEQGDAGIVDEDVERGMGGGRGRRELQNLFRRADIHAKEACDGQQAIEQLAACQPDIILIDYMPMMNGIEAARLVGQSLRERQSSLDFVRFRIAISPMDFSRQAP